jgi:tetratricopeptide (TPR) repeat protein
MSLLLDALKRAEEAKRAKAEIAEGSAAPSVVRDAIALPSTSNVPTPPPINEFAALSLSDLDIDLSAEPVTTSPQILPVTASAPAPAPAPVIAPTTTRLTTSIKPLALSTDLDLPPVRATPLTGVNTISTEETALAELLQLELDSDASYRAAPNTAPATAAYRAARSQESAAAIKVNAASASSTTNTSKSIEATNADAIAIAPVTTHNEQAQRDAVKNAFNVKQSTRKSTRAKWVIPVMAGLVFFVGAGSWYVWQEINRGARPMLASAPNPIAAQTTPPAEPTPTPPTAQSPTFAPNTGVINTASDQAKSAPSASSTELAAIAAKAELDALPPLLPPPAIAIAAPVQPKSKSVTVTFTPREALAKKIEDLPLSPPSSASMVKLRPAKIEASIGLNPALAAAYAALNRGDYAAAKQTYASAIAQQPTNLDANLGFATAAARSGETEMALRYYRRVLDLDPRNATATAALLTLDNKSLANESSGQVSMEAELKLLIEKEPNAAVSYFALGNLLAGERRWREAQQAFFEAARLTPQNPDYLYNLAVSLDNLGQTKQAEDFYRRALAALVNGQAQFDRAVVEKRLSAMAAVAANNIVIK